jgi:putative membrane protein
MNTATTLPHVTAGLNALSLCFLSAAYVFIRQGRRDLHKRAMLAAVAASVLFLAFYLLYHFTAPIFVFRGAGAVRPVYYALLISHVILAALVTPMIALTLFRALKGRFEAHGKVARWTFPVWVYVSVTGIVVYLMLYHVYT